jgi:hypothetical protein
MRPAQPDEEGTGFGFDDGTDLDDWEEGWEGLDDAFLAMTEDELEVFGRLIYEDRMSGTDLNMTAYRILAAYNAQLPSTTRSFELPLVPGSGQEYVGVFSIIEGLWVAYPLVGRSNFELNTALIWLADCEEHADTMSINEAYEEAGLKELAKRLREEHDAEVDTLAAHFSSVAMYVWKGSRCFGYRGLFF